MILARLVLFIALLFVVGCGGSDVSDPDLDRLEVVARHLSSPRHLRGTVFPTLQDQQSPSGLVSYLFSDLGVAEWPPSESSDEHSKEEARSIRAPLFPAAGVLVHARPDSHFGKQLVLRGDDEMGEIVADAYLDPKQAPIWSRRWAMPGSQ